MMLLDPLDPRVHEWLARAARWEAAVLRLAALSSEARASEHEATMAELRGEAAAAVVEITKRAETARAALTESTAALEIALGPFLDNPPPGTAEKALQRARVLLKDPVAALVSRLPPAVNVLWSLQRKPVAAPPSAA